MLAGAVAVQRGSVIQGVRLVHLGALVQRHHQIIVIIVILAGNGLLLLLLLELRNNLLGAASEKSQDVHHALIVLLCEALDLEVRVRHERLHLAVHVCDVQRHYLVDQLHDQRALLRVHDFRLQIKLLLLLGLGHVFTVAVAVVAAVLALPGVAVVVLLLLLLLLLLVLLWVRHGARGAAVVEWHDLLLGALLFFAGEEHGERDFDEFHDKFEEGGVILETCDKRNEGGLREGGENHVVEVDLGKDIKDLYSSLCLQLIVFCNDGEKLEIEHAEVLCDVIFGDLDLLDERFQHCVGRDGRVFWRLVDVH